MIRGRYWQYEKLQRKRETREAIKKLCWVVAPVAVLLVAVWMKS